MPLPFLAIVGIGTALVGVGKSAKAAYDQHDAKETNSTAQDIVRDAKKKITQARDISGSAVTALGNCKIDILDNSIKPFIESFEKLHSVDLMESDGLNELSNFKIDRQSFEELKELQIMATSIAGGVASGAALGAATAFGAYGGAMTFAAASTGTAIASLSGAAATNATLAFLGGGSLAVGGLGVAGGTAVLGGLVAGPALAVLGFVAGAKASANRDNAHANLAKAEEFEEEMDLACTACKGIFMRANLFTRLLYKLDAIFQPIVFDLDNIIKTSGTDYSKFTTNQKETIAATLSVAGAIKAVLDTPILTEDGGLTQESESIASSVQKVLTDNNV